jgi:hypothetical protein
MKKDFAILIMILGVAAVIFYATVVTAIHVLKPLEPRPDQPTPEPKFQLTPLIGTGVEISRLEGNE